LLPKGKRRTKNQRFEFKNMVLPPAYEEKIRRQEMTFVQAHKAMRHLAYRLAKGMLSDDQLVGLFTPHMLPCHAHIHTYRAWRVLSEASEVLRMAHSGGDEGGEIDHAQRYK
jgi:hypothetical protein